MGFRFQDFGFGFRVPGFGFRFSDFGFRVTGFIFLGFGFRVSGFGLWIQVFGFQVKRVEFRAQSLGWRPGARRRFRVRRLDHQILLVKDSVARRALRRTQILPVQPASGLRCCPLGRRGGLIPRRAPPSRGGLIGWARPSRGGPLAAGVLAD